MHDSEVSDNDCLKAFARSHDEAAFRALVSRHAGMVRAVARRKLGSEHLAEEVAQTVFITLSRKAASLVEVGSLGAWLHRVTVLECRKAWRNHLRERKGKEMMREFEPNGSSAPDTLRGEVDDAFERLSRADREVLTLHYIEGHTFPEAAQYLHTSPEGARKRCSRALEKLTGILRTRGVAMPSAALVGWLASEFAPAAGPAAVRKLTGVALAKSTTEGGITALILTMKVITIGSFTLGAIAPYCWGLGSDWAGSVPEANRPHPPPVIAAKSSDDDVRGKRGQRGGFDLEAVKRSFARFDASPEPERWLEVKLRKLMFALNAEELAEVSNVLAKVTHKTRFSEIACALFARLAEIDGPGAVAKALTFHGFGREPLRGAFVTWAAADEDMALSWLENNRVKDGCDVAMEWLRWKIGVDTEGLGQSAARLARMFPDRKASLSEEVVRSWLARDVDAAARWAASEPDTKLRNLLLSKLVRIYGEANGLDTFLYASWIDDPENREAVLNETLRWTGVRGGYRMMKDLATAGFSDAWSDENLRKFSSGMMVNRPDQLPTLVKLAANDEQRQRIFEGALEGAMWTEPCYIVDAANGVSDSFVESARGHAAFENLVNRWLLRDPAEARKWLESLNPGIKRNIALTVDDRTNAKFNPGSQEVAR